MDAANAVNRAYGYVHVADAFWSMYRVARNYPSIPLSQTWEWYLYAATQTILTMTNSSISINNVEDGLMEETVFVYILDDLKREGFTANATLLESRMKARQEVWASTRFP